MVALASLHLLPLLLQLALVVAAVEQELWLVVLALLVEELVRCTL
jgi:hypothetical protein